MYKEKVKPVGKTIFFVIGIIATALVLVWLLDAAVIFFNLPYRSLFQLAILVLMAVGVYILIRNIISEYEYAIVDNEIIITSKLGDNERLVAKLCLEQIKFVAFHSAPEAKHTQADGKYNARKSLVSTNTYVCFFEDDGKIYKLSFEPSEKLLKILKERGVNVK